MNELPKRKPNRLQNYDYSQNGAYFVTVCIKDRHEILGNIPVGATVPGRPFPASDHPFQTIDHPFQTVPRMELSEIGQIVDEAIKYYKENLAGVIFDRYVIMPNHIHAIIVIRSETGDRGENNTGDRGRSPLQNIVRNLKSYVTKKAGFSPWQRSFHDHIIRNETDYNRIAEYIENNPANWEKDCFFTPDKMT